MTDAQFLCDDLKKRFIELEKSLSDPSSDCYIERLLDVVIAAVNDAQFAAKNKENEHLFAFQKRFGGVAKQLQTYRRQPQDFHLIASLGRGAFGHVQLVREVSTGRVCAMKVLEKSRVLRQFTDFWTEREIMARCDSPWIVQLFYAFQDLTSLYMVMEYVPGGTLVGWMEDANCISEAACRFYAAETILALSDLHAMGFIHRDLKPDNLLLDARGHVKLADFGTAIRVDPETGLIHCDAAVGTPDYLSPEVLLSQGGGGGSYGLEVDWWALGVLVFEMLYGDTPFYSEALVHTYAKIMSHANTLHFPESVNVSESAMDFMKQLLRGRETRLGSGPNGSEDVQRHPWFSSEWADAQKASDALNPSDASLVDWNWSNIRACRAPFQPQLTSETDTAYFQLYSEDEEDLEPVNGDVPDEVPSGESHEPRTNGGSEADQSWSKHPGAQLAFAGFSFSSPHSNHLALLAPKSHAADPRSCLIPNSVNRSVNGSVPECDRPSSTLSQPEHDVPNSPTSLQLTRMQTKLDDALALVEMYYNEVLERTEQLDKVDSQRRELEAKFLQREAAHQTVVEELQKRIELNRSEAATNLALAEAEVAKWKSIAQAARQSAETAEHMAQATATKRLVKLVDELAAQRRGSLTSSLIRDDDDDDDHVGAKDSCPSSKLASAENNGAIESTAPPDVPDGDEKQTATANLLKRIEELVKRAQRAEEVACETADMLKEEKRFCRLYKVTSDEKSDQIKELKRAIDGAHDLLASCQQDCRRYHEDYEAARRALTEEKQRSLRQQDALRCAEEREHSAIRSEALARREAAKLRETLEQMKRALEMEKQKSCSALNKLGDVMLGKDVNALQMIRAAGTHSKDGGGLSPAQHRILAKLVGDRQQRQLDHQSRQIKRLQDEIKRLNVELGSTRRELELSRLREDPRFSSNVNHSRETSDDLASSSVGRTPMASHHVRQRSGLFGRSKLVNLSSDNVASSERLPVFAKTLEPHPPQSPAYMPVQRCNSLGERSLHAVTPASLCSPSPVDRMPSPIDVTNFPLAGMLQMGIRQPRKKKLAWCNRFVKLTYTHLFVWECDPETASNLSHHASFPPNHSPLLELPLHALYRVRQADPSEAIHEGPATLAFAFQITYDKSISDACVSEASRPLSPNQATSMTLPRKFSFGSTAIGSTQTTSSFLRRHPDSANGKHSSLLGNSTECMSPSSTANAHHVLLIRGHKLQSIRFPLMAVCDVCHKRCSQLVNPPPAFQCVNCQLKFHAAHLDAQDFFLPNCGKPIASHLFRCQSQAEQEKWIAHISMAIKYANERQSHDQPTSPKIQRAPDGLSVYSPDPMLLDTTTTLDSSRTSAEISRLPVFSQSPTDPYATTSCDRVIITDPPPVHEHSIQFGDHSDPNISVSEGS